MVRYGQTLTLTMTTGDTALPFSMDADLIFDDCNIHIYSNDIYYGDAAKAGVATQGAATPDCSVGKKDAVLTFRHLVINTMFFKSYTSGLDAFLVITGTLQER